MKPLHWKLALIAAVTLWAIWQVWPRTEHTFANVKLGLDLRGGSYLVMQVQTDDAIKAEADIEATRIGERLRKEGFTDARAITGDETGQVVVSGIPAARLGEAERIVTEESGDWSVDTSGAGIQARMPRA
ncbi:MAG: preprotein translocase subunit SecD, partial [Acidobacteria bacterium]|nr:preprotein translocase subunit SecD [Acidobacteriota bacterium]